MLVINLFCHVHLCIHLSNTVPLGFTDPLGFWGGEGNGTPLQYSCLENPMDGGAW